jgi:TonB family protein
MSTIRNAAISLLLVSMAAPFLQAQEIPATVSSYPNTAAGLHDLLTEVRAFAVHQEMDKVGAAVKDMEIPSHADWFHKTYPQSADSWIGPYETNLQGNERSMQERFAKLATDDGDFTVRKVNDSPQPGRGMEWGMLASMKQPVDIYCATWKSTKSSDSPASSLVGYFMYIDGGFRWDSLIRAVEIRRAAVESVSPGMASAAPSDLDQVYRVGNGVSAPRVSNSPDPAYSKEARKKKIEGTVVLWVVVGTDGTAQQIRVQRSLGYGLDEEAIKAVKKWKFTPATKDGQPVAVQINIVVNFRLYYRLY